MPNISTNHAIILPILMELIRTNDKRDSGAKFTSPEF